METFTINFSRKKVLYLLLYSNIFLIAGLIFFFKNSEIANEFSKLNNTTLNKVFGVFILLIWLVAVLHLIKTYFSKKPGFIVDENGITNNSSAFPTKLFPWKDINSVEIRTQKLPIGPSQQYLTIKFKNPNVNPKDISTNALEISLEELLEKVQKYLMQSKLNDRQHTLNRDCQIFGSENVNLHE